ncbi:hypothetical protein BGZ93_000952 [Podila epicladia]|nr:hypothetical protein BGZ92_009495 [Podila epicladia]KAG0084913.1 hypothetical protein BGZ93_000952 [Podila epicladia]
MVRLSLSFLATALAAVASAAPVYTQHAFNKIADARCLPHADIREYQSFELLSHELDTYVSKKFDSTRLVGGVNGDKNLQQLEFCIVSSDHHCDPIFPTNCILENVEYRMRVKGPESAYLQIDGHYVRIVRNFDDASPLSLSNDDLQGVRIAYQYEDGGDKNVFATSKSTEYGKPIVLEYPQKSRVRQRFEMIKSRKAMTEIGDKECIPQTKQYHPFKLLSANLDTFLSMKLGDKMVYGGASHDPRLQALDFCIVSEDKECTTAIHSDCVYQNVEYRFRVFGPIKGYLRVIDEELVEIVPEFNQASGLSVYNERGLGLRVAHRKSNGDLMVITTSAPGLPVFLEEPQKNNGRQWFDLVQPRDMNMDIESEPNQCVPHVAVKEYEAFELYSYNLDSIVSNLPGHNVLVGGDIRNKHLQQLQFCIVSSDHECNPKFPTNCIYENVQYRYRVHSPEKGYLRIQDGLIRIVPDFEDATGLNLLSDGDYGLRIAKQNKKGSVSVLATTVPGEPLTLQGAAKRTNSQFFAFAKPSDNLEKKTTSLKRCLPDTNVKVYEPFIVRNHEFDTPISTLEGNNFLRAGVNGNKQFQKLEFTVAPFFGEDATGECLREDFQYRFRVTGQISGYVKVQNGFLVVVPEFDEASPLYFHKSSGQGLRIGQDTPVGPFAVATNHPGSPLVLERPESGNKRQVFDLIPSNRVNKEEPRKRCLPNTAVKVHQPFIVMNQEFDTLISTVQGNNLLRAGVDGNKQFEKLEFTVIPFIGDDATSECIYEDVEYLFRVTGQISGFLRIEDGNIAIVPMFSAASPMYFHKSSGQGVRIGQMTHTGPYVVATTHPGSPLALQRVESGNKHQLFDLIPSNGVNMEETRKKCLPDTAVKVHQPFIVMNQEFDTLISTVQGNNLLRAGVDGNKQFEKLEFTVSPFSEDDATSECIYEDVQYRFRVTGQISGFLRIVDGAIAIVPEFDAASPMYFHKSSSQGVRIGQMTLTGPYVVTTTYPGFPLAFQRVQSGNKRQLFELIPSNKDNKEIETCDDNKEHSLW